jgi:hypothetical protein
MKSDHDTVVRSEPELDGHGPGHCRAGSKAAVATAAVHGRRRAAAVPTVSHRIRVRPAGRARASDQDLSLEESRFKPKVLFKLSESHWLSS